MNKLTEEIHDLDGEAESLPDYEMGALSDALSDHFPDSRSELERPPPDHASPRTKARYEERVIWHGFPKQLSEALDH